MLARVGKKGMPAPGEIQYEKVTSRHPVGVEDLKKGRR